MADPEPSTAHDQLLSERLQGWQPDVRGTLLFLRDGDQVLLIRKKRGHGAGKINGPGGKIDPGETPLQAALRETREETGVQVSEAELMAEFRFLDLVSLQWYGYVFLAHEWQGTPVETPEADPFWCPIAELPFDQMWDDDRYWLPRLLAGERLRGDFLFDDGVLLAHRLNTLMDVDS
jgi:8-oxo-dGTP diphosphatase